MKTSIPLGSVYLLPKAAQVPISFFGNDREYVIKTVMLS
jgi:hypothetical protein